jgi:hypothetical protein
MVRCIRLRYHRLSHHDILTKEVIKGRVRKPVSAGMRNLLLQGKFFKDITKATSAQSVNTNLEISCAHALSIKSVRNLHESLSAYLGARE